MSTPKQGVGWTSSGPPCCAGARSWPPPPPTVRYRAEPELAAGPAGSTDEFGPGLIDRIVTTLTYALMPSVTKPRPSLRSSPYNNPRHPTSATVAPWSATCWCHRPPDHVTRHRRFILWSRRSMSVQLQPTVDADLLSGDVARIITDQKGDQVRDLVRATMPAARYGAQYPVAIRLRHRQQPWSGDEPRQDTVRALVATIPLQLAVGAGLSGVSQSWSCPISNCFSPQRPSSTRACAPRPRMPW